MQTLAPTFDYAALDAETRIVVQQEDKEFERNVGDAGEHFLRACHNVHRIQNVLKYKRPGFVDWLSSKRGLSKSTAYRMCEVAQMFPNLGNIAADPSALYLLAADSTPEELREHFIDKARNGEQVTHAAVKAAVAESKPFTQADADRQRAELDAIDPLLTKHREDKERKATRRIEPTDDHDAIMSNDFQTNRKPANGKPKGRGVEIAHNAIAVLKTIPPNDALREDGLRIVAQWIRDNK